MAIPPVEVRAALGAVVGGLLWTIKGLGILLADYEPEYAFAFAAFFFGLAAMGVAARVNATRGKAWRATGALAAFATAAGGAAALLYVVSGDSSAFGVALMFSFLSLLAVLIYAGWLVRDWSPIPVLLAAVTLFALPVGGALSEIDERLLEIPLVIVAGGWITLGLRFWREVKDEAGEAPAAATTI